MLAKKTRRLNFAAKGQLGGARRQVRSPTFEGPVASQEAGDLDSSSHGPGELIFFREGTTVWLSHLREGWVPAVVVSVQSTSEIVVAPDREASIKYGMKSPSSSLRPTSSRDHVVVDLEQKDAHPKVLPRQARVKADDFGAVGDGKVDDGPALQRAIDAAQGANKVVIGVAAMTSFLCSLVHFVMHRITKQISTQPVRHRVYSSLGVNVPWAVESLRRRLVYFERRVAIETY